MLVQAQPDNMELLDACLEKKVRLIDYEKMCDLKGKKKSALNTPYTGFDAGVKTKNFA